MVLGFVVGVHDGVGVIVVTLEEKNACRGLFFLFSAGFGPTDTSLRKYD
jgi:hypothetical protein